VTRCKGCGKEYRKGVRAFLLTASGLAGVRVCQACARRGIILVAPLVAPVVKQAVVRPDGFSRVLRMLRTYARAAETVGNPERAQGFEGAIEALKRECVET
jgi:hypothetical protein